MKRMNSIATSLIRLEADEEGHGMRTAENWRDALESMCEVASDDEHKALSFLVKNVHVAIAEITEGTLVRILREDDS